MTFRGLSLSLCGGEPDSGGPGRALALRRLQTQVLGGCAPSAVLWFQGHSELLRTWGANICLPVTSAARVILLCCRQMPYLFGWSEPLIPNSGSASEGERPGRLPAHPLPAPTSHPGAPRTARASASARPAPPRPPPAPRSSAGALVGVSRLSLLLRRTQRELLVLSPAPTESYGTTGIKRSRRARRPRPAAQRAPPVRPRSSPRTRVLSRPSPSSAPPGPRVCGPHSCRSLNPNPSGAPILVPLSWAKRAGSLISFRSKTVARPDGPRSALPGRGRCGTSFFRITKKRRCGPPWVPFSPLKVSDPRRCGVSRKHTGEARLCVDLENNLRFNVHDTFSCYEILCSAVLPRSKSGMATAQLHCGVPWESFDNRNFHLAV
ncbi:uncharacterized protein RHO17_012731 [Thomomys bottae]